MNKVIINFAGDFCSCSPEDIKISDELKNILHNSDMNVLNFEGPLSSNELCTANKTILKQSEQTPLWCKNHKFEIVSIANNHSFDYSEEGLRKTISALKNNGVTPVGAGTWDEAYKVTIKKIGKYNIGFYAATSCDLAALKDKYYDQKTIGCAWINHYDTRRIIANIKEKCDYLFIMPHAGVEYMNIPLPEWREIYKELIDLGADAIIASHPHVPQGVEVYNGSPIFYSLGNFFFEGSGDITKPKHKYWNTGLIIQITLTDEGLSYETIITKRDMYNLSIEKSDAIHSYWLEINDILNNDEKYIINLNENVLEFYKKYKTWLLAGLNAKEINLSLREIASIIKSILYRKKANYRLAMHQIREESTLWTMQRAFKILSKTKL